MAILYILPRYHNNKEIDIIPKPTNDRHISFRNREPINKIFLGILEF
jgi:hypothetical protein